MFVKVVLNQCLNAVAFAASGGCVSQTVPDNSTVLVKFEKNLPIKLILKN